MPDPSRTALPSEPLPRSRAKVTGNVWSGPRRTLLWLVAGTVVTMLVALHVGVVVLTPAQVASALTGGVVGDVDASGVLGVLLWDLRGPRVVMTALVGAALGLAGALVQCLTRNPLADPGLLGASAGSALFVLPMLAFAPGWATSPFAGPVASMGGAALAGVLVGAWALGRRGFGPFELVLVGLAVNLLLGATTSLVVLSLPAHVHRAMVAWISGSFGNADWTSAVAVTVALAITLPLAWGHARSLDVHGLGDEVPVGLGQRLGRVRLGMAAGVVVLSGAAYAVAGGVGFVGLVAPHIARSLVGHRHASLVPAATLVGACLVVAADAVGRFVTRPVDTPAGLVVALLGGPCFLALLVWTAVRGRPR